MTALPRSLDGRRPQLIKSNRGAQATYDFLQWPAMVTILVPSWLAASQLAKRRKLAFLGFVLGNVLWIVWGLYVEAYALALLDGILCGMNIRGFLKNKTATQRGETDAA